MTCPRCARPARSLHPAPVPGDPVPAHVCADCAIDAWRAAEAHVRAHRQLVAGAADERKRGLWW